MGHFDEKGSFFLYMQDGFHFDLLIMLCPAVSVRVPMAIYVACESFVMILSAVFTAGNQAH